MICLLRASIIGVGGADSSGRENYIFKAFGEGIIAVHIHHWVDSLATVHLLCERFSLYPIDSLGGIELPEAPISIYVGDYLDDGVIFF